MGSAIKTIDDALALINNLPPSPTRLLVSRECLERLRDVFPVAKAALQAPTALTVEFDPTVAWCEVEYTDGSRRVIERELQEQAARPASSCPRCGIDLEEQAHTCVGDGDPPA